MYSYSCILNTVIMLYLLCIKLKTVIMLYLLCIKLKTVIMLYLLCIKLKTVIMLYLLCIKLNAVIMLYLLCIKLKTVIMLYLLCNKLKTVIMLYLLCIKLKTVIMFRLVEDEWLNVEEDPYGPVHQHEGPGDQGVQPQRYVLRHRQPLCISTFPTMCASKRVRISCCATIYTIYLSIYLNTNS